MAHLNATTYAGKHQRNYLTSADFAHAQDLPSTVPNGTVFDPPEDDIEDEPVCCSLFFHLKYELNVIFCFCRYRVMHSSTTNGQVLESRTLQTRNSVQVNELPLLRHSTTTTARPVYDSQRKHPATMTTFKYYVMTILAVWPKFVKLVELNLPSLEGAASTLVS